MQQHDSSRRERRMHPNKNFHLEHAGGLGHEGNRQVVELGRVVLGQEGDGIRLCGGGDEVPA